MDRHVDGVEVDAYARRRTEARFVLEWLEKRGFDAETRRRNGAIWADLYQSYAARSKKVRDELAAIEDTLLALLERLHEGARLGDSVARFLDP